MSDALMKVDIAGMKSTCDVLVIGGGFFGMYIAEYFAHQGKRVVLCEKERDFMQRASYINQARVHNGYHYPRSILTALRSRMSFPRFVDEFSDCIDDSFEKYYMIGRLLGNVTAKQFDLFCSRIGVPCDRAPNRVSSMVNPNLIEAVFSTVEYVFDAVKLKNVMHDRIDQAAVDYHLSTKVIRVLDSDGGLLVETRETGDTADARIYSARQVFNCTYSMINEVLGASRLNGVSLKHEMTEICLVDVPDELKDKGITVMCGPFFSVMPFPARGLHSFTHVRYTPHFHWFDAVDTGYVNGHDYLAAIEKKSNWKRMLLDAKRYIPLLSQCRYHESIWEVKTVLPRSESNDARPILFKRDQELAGMQSIMGGKIDNVYDAIREIDRGYQRTATSVGHE